MKTFAKLIRIVTVAPLVSLYLLLALYFLVDGAFASSLELFMAIGFLTIFPALSFPLQKQFHIIKGDEWEAERKMAIIMSVIGYTAGAVFAFLFGVSTLQKIVYLTYSLSGLAVAMFSFYTSINASGHMCGVAGPVAALVYIYGAPLLWLGLLLVIIYWASVHVNRHSPRELIYGTAIPIAALLLSILIIG